MTTSSFFFFFSMPLPALALAPRAIRSVVFYRDVTLIYEWVQGCKKIVDTKLIESTLYDIHSGSILSSIMQSKLLPVFGCNI